MFRRRRFQRLFVRLALLATLCQALLPTLAYSAASSDPAALTEVARAFGLGRICSATPTPDYPGGPHPVSHAQGVHCPLCLAQTLAVGLPSAVNPVIPPAPAATPEYLVTESTHVPPLPDLAWARAPPRSSDFAFHSHC